MLWQRGKRKGLKRRRGSHEQYGVVLRRCADGLAGGNCFHPSYLRMATQEEAMSMVYFFVPGKVQGKARPRFSSRSGTVYTPGRTKSYERQIAEAYAAQHGPCFEGAVMVVIEAVFPVPKSWTRAKKAEAMAGKLPPGKPDIDNILKVVLDGLNGIAYEDDKQVVLTQCKKVYADTTRPAGLQVHVIPMENANGCY